MFSDSERISFCHFREKNSEMTTRFRVQGVLKGIGGPLKNTTPPMHRDGLQKFSGGYFWKMASVFSGA